MNYRILTIFVLLYSFTINAQNRSESEMKRIAARVLSSSVQKTRSLSDANLKVCDSRDMLTVVGNELHGFVIISNNKNFPAVVGYSYSQFSSLPPALDWYLSVANNAMAMMEEEGKIYSSIPPTEGIATHLDPLLATEWNQSKPYNNLCPGGNGSTSLLYPTGCVATALAQIMNYHKYPEVGMGSHQYSFQPSSGDGRIISANFGETHYDWANMLDTYKSEYTDAQANAVATLMLHCGVAVDMSYTASGSGSYGVEACNGIRNYFRYNKGASLYNRDYYSAELWMQMIYQELNKKRPIYYAGSSEGQGGHAFVIDGYNEEGLVHVNWGWGGKSNGYYDIALLNPTGYRFSESQDMILNFCDSTENIPSKSQLGAKELIFNFYGTTVKRVSISSSKILNIGADVFKGSFAAILENADTTIVLKSQDGIYANPFLGGQAFYATLSLQSNNLSTIPDGTYHLYAGSKSATDTNWQLIRTIDGIASSYVVTKSGDNVTWEASPNDLWTNATTTSLKTVYNNVSCSTNTIYNLQGRNMGTNPSALPKGIYIIDGKKVVK